MTEEVKAPEASLGDEQVRLLRTSLINTTFAKYHELADILKKLPINQNIPGIVQAYLFIDSGMLWFKEILNTTALMFAQAPLAAAPPSPAEEVQNDVALPQEVSPENS